jgi:hypothetical protein
MAKETSIENKKMLFDLEVLKARLEIRDFFLKTTVKDIYENVGQVLSLVRMQLAVLNPDISELPVDELVSSGHLVGQSIRDLRNMSRSFYPDEDITKEEGITNALRHTIHVLGSSCKIKQQSTAIENDMEAGLKLITFKMLLDVLISIDEAKGELHSITISTRNQNLVFAIAFSNELKEHINKIEINTLHLSFAEPLQLLNGQYSWKNTTSGNNRILFTVPCKLPNYE